MDMLDEKTADLFARVSGLGEKELTALKEKNPEKFEHCRIKGMELFKRKMLGICGKKTVKSSDEISSALYELGITPSLEHGKSLISYLNNKDMDMGEKLALGLFPYIKYLKIEETGANAGQYKIFVWNDHDPDFDPA
jgi:hypothetical protein